MNSNIITQNALARLNNEKQSVLVDQAGAKITYILREQAMIKNFQENIKLVQEQIGKIASDVLTAEMVFGRTVSSNPTPNEAVILNAIKDRNDSKQKKVEMESKQLLEAIDGYNASIAGCNGRIEKLREELNSLVADVVTEEQLLG